MSKKREKCRKPRQTVKNVEKPVKNRQKYRKKVKMLKNCEKTFKNVKNKAKNH